MKNWASRDRDVIWHPFTPQKSMTNPIPIVRGEGTLLFDEAGNNYIDAISSWWVTLHGHAHPAIAKALYEQASTLEQVIFAGFTHEPAIALAESLLPILPGIFSKIFYSDNGSTSTEVAIKMSLQYWWNEAKVTGKTSHNRNKILAFNNSYHGDTFGAMSVSDRSVFTAPFSDHLFEVIFIDTPTRDNLLAIKEKIAAEGESIAAFIYEPLVQGAGGLKMYEPALMNEVLACVQSHQIICIADEVMTGFGRTGTLFASEQLDFSPDLICLSKGLTGGTMALGVTAVNERIYRAFVKDDPHQTFFHGHSFTANPLACRAALTSLQLLQTTSCQQQIKLIKMEHQQFALQLSQYAKVKQVRQLGTILAFEIDQGSNHYLNHLAPIITEKALSMGVYLRPLGNTVYLMPPYCITKTELQTCYRVIEKILESL